MNAWTGSPTGSRVPATGAAMRRVVIVRGNPVAPDPRVERVARTLARSGFKVTVVGWDREGAFPPSLTLGSHTKGQKSP